MVVSKIKPTFEDVKKKLKKPSFPYLISDALLPAANGIVFISYMTCRVLSFYVMYRFLRACFVRNCNGLKSSEYLILCEGETNLHKLMSNHRVIYPLPFSGRNAMQL